MSCSTDCQAAVRLAKIKQWAEVLRAADDGTVQVTAKAVVADVLEMVEGPKMPAGMKELAEYLFAARMAGVDIIAPAPKKKGSQ